MTTPNHILSEKKTPRLILQKNHKKKILLIGNNKETIEIGENVNKISCEYCVIGCMRTHSRERVQVMPKPNIHIFGDLSEMEIFLKMVPLKINVMIITDPEIRHHQIIRILKMARKYCVQVWAMPQLPTAFIGNLKFFSFYGHPVVRISGSEISPFKVAAKNVLDYTAALVGLALATPLMLLAALLIKLTSRGTVFIKQTRVGQHEKLFNVIKFRSMSFDAERVSGPVLWEMNDHRVTPVGRFLRRTHLDELPQLFNILNGTMSLVGPRPERPFFVSSFNRYIPFYSDRFAVKPGITGMAQVYGGYHTKAEEKLIFDLNYIHNLNIFLDIKICFLTLVEAVKGLVKPKNY